MKSNSSEVSQAASDTLSERDSSGPFIRNTVLNWRLSICLASPQCGSAVSEIRGTC